MTTQEQIHYKRIEEAIGFISANFKAQPSLEEIAEHVHLSPGYFQRLFTDWAGVSPKKFMQYLSVNYAKQLLKENQLSLGAAAFETGLSGTGRLHDLFVNIEAMTPGEYKQGGKHLQINYSYAESPFGQLLLASTPKGICHIAFIEDEKQSLDDLKAKFPQAQYRNLENPLHIHALAIFQQDWEHMPQVKLHLHGTVFQLKVWEALLKIPMAKLSSYGNLAHAIDKPKASRAVGTAIGSNPVAFLIPCHRVIQSSGNIGGYMWGSTRKSAIIAWEAVRA